MSLITSIKSLLHLQAGFRSVQVDLMNDQNAYFQYILRREQLTHSANTSAEKGISSDKYEQEEVIISLTTFGSRLYEAFLAIESIMQGTRLPNRLILWLAEDEKAKEIPLVLQKQMKRGLEIRYCKDLRSYKKLIPTLRAFPEAIIVTIDDDAFYQYDFLENLLMHHKSNPKAIISYRVDRLQMSTAGELKAYSQRIPCTKDGKTTPLNMMIGVDGVLYPPHSLHDEVLNESVFMEECKSADDVWFWAMAALNHTPIINCPIHWKRHGDTICNYYVQDVSLKSVNENPETLLNDLQISRVVSRYDLANYLMS